jgi:hypothetical protein
LPAGGDQRVLGGEVGRQVAFGEIGAVAERFLRVDHQKT